MKKSLIVFFTMLLAVSCLFMLSACGDKNSNNDNNNNNNGTNPPGGNEAETALTEQEIRELTANTVFTDGSFKLHYKDGYETTILTMDRANSKMMLSLPNKFANLYVYASGGKYFTVIEMTSSHAEYYELSKYEFIGNTSMSDGSLFDGNLAYLLNYEADKAGVEFYYGEDYWTFDFSGEKVTDGDCAYLLKFNRTCLSDDEYGNKNILHTLKTTVKLDSQKRITEAVSSLKKHPDCTGAGETPIEKITTAQVFYDAKDLEFELPDTTNAINKSKSEIYLYDTDFPDDFNPKVEAGGTVTLPDPKPKAGLTFEGWYYDSSYKHLVEDGIFTVGFGFGSNPYPKWTRESTVTLEPFGGILPDYNDSDINYSNYYNSYCRPIKYGWEFKHWCYDKELTEPVSYYDNRIITQDITLYAKYEKQVKITLEGVDYLLPSLYGVADTPISPPKKLYNGDLSDVGWVNRTTNFPNEDTVFTAQFISGGTLINIDKTEMPDNINVHSKYVIYRSNVPLFLTDFHRELKNCFDGYINPEGKVFAGWYTDAELTQPFNDIVPSGSTLYPKFEKPIIITAFYGENLSFVEYLIVQQDDSYIGNPNQPLDYYLSQFHIYPPAGMSIEGYYLDSDFSTKCDTTVSPTTSVKVYCKFQ